MNYAHDGSSHAASPSLLRSRRDLHRATVQVFDERIGDSLGLAKGDGKPLCFVLQVLLLARPHSVVGPD